MENKFGKFKKKTKILSKIELNRTIFDWYLGQQIGVFYVHFMWLFYYMFAWIEIHS